MKFLSPVLIALFVSIIGFTACGENNNAAQSVKKGDGKIAWQNIETGIESARLQEKKLFVYVYTDWCSWCRRMEDEVFSNDRVAEYMNDKYIPVALDAESQQQVRFDGRNVTEQQVASMLGVEGFPTSIFMSPAGEPITVAPGYLPPDRFINVLSYIADDHYRHTEWEEYMDRQGG
jgi:thioredoxin-related protein